ncbi:MAG: peptidoglycan editing factor PgeF [Saprospiraceae bacterium]
MLFFRPGIFASCPELIAAQSTRHGGVSSPPYHSLNLGWNTGDRPAHTDENRRRFAAAVGFDPDNLAYSKQVHGVEVLHALRPGFYSGYDALITQQPGLVLAVGIADCAPVLVYDPRHRAVAAIHAGWRGMAGEIILRALTQMRALFGTSGSDCLAYIGPCIDACAFEVGEEVALQFEDAFKRFDSAAGKYFIDLKRAAVAQLQVFGLPESQVEISPYSTVCDNADFFSYRLEKGETGRLLAVIGMGR